MSLAFVNVDNWVLLYISNYIKRSSKITFLIEGYKTQIPNLSRGRTKALVKIENSYLVSRQSPLCLLFAAQCSLSRFFVRKVKISRGFLLLRSCMTLGIPSSRNTGRSKGLGWNKGSHKSFIHFRHTKKEWIRSTIFLPRQKNFFDKELFLPLPQWSHWLFLPATHFHPFFVSQPKPKSSLDRDNGDERSLLFILFQCWISQETRSKPETPFLNAKLGKRREENI